MIQYLFFSEERTSLFVEDPDGKRVLISVYIGPHGSHHKYVEEKASYCTIAVVSISGKTKWEMLDAMVRRAFKVLPTTLADYLLVTRDVKSRKFKERHKY